MIILVGPPGSGAEEIADVLKDSGHKVVYSDDVAEQNEGLSLSDLAIVKGSEHYAEAEQKAAIQALESDADVVVLGSGALGNQVDDQRGSAVRDKLSEVLSGGATKLFLTAEPKVLLRRAGMDAPRSVAIGSPRSMYLTQLKARTPLYTENAETVDTSDGKWERLASEILSAK